MPKNFWTPAAPPTMPLAELCGGGPRGLLRVSMPVVVGERLLGPHLPAFCARYPDLRLEIDLSDRNIPLVETGFDLAIRVGLLADSILRAQLLGAVPVRLVASPALVKTLGPPSSPADLGSTWPCITLGYGAGPVDWTFWPDVGLHTPNRSASRAQSIPPAPRLPHKPR